MNQIIKVLAILLISLISLSTFAQKNMEDVVYLKNGSIIKGEIIEINDNQVKIQILGGSIL